MLKRPNGFLAAALALVILCSAPQAWAEDATACTRITDRIARLSCFDNAMRTPLPAQSPATVQQAVSPESHGPLQTLAEDQELSRQGGATGWITRIRPWGSDMFLNPDKDPDAVTKPPGTEAAEQVDVFLSEPEENPQDDSRAILMVTCENNITSLRAILPQAINGPRAVMTLSGGGSVLRLNWRDMEQGKVIGAGRGLESIDTIKAILPFKQVQLKVALHTATVTYNFSINGLAERLKPLRLACHW